MGFLTVALVHCALAAQDTQTEVRFPDLPRAVQHCTNHAAAMETLKNNPGLLAMPTAGSGIDAEIEKQAILGLDAEDDAFMSEQIRIVSKIDGEPQFDTDFDFSISRKAAAKMLYVKAILDGDRTAGAIEEKNNTAIEGVIQIDARHAKPEVLRYVVEYVQKLTQENRTPKDISKPISSTNILKCIAGEDGEDAQAMLELFAEGQGRPAVFDVILAASYLDMKILLHLGCVQIATQIKGKSPAEIKQILGEDIDDATNAAAPRRRRTGYAGTVR